MNIITEAYQENHQEFDELIIPYYDQESLKTQLSILGLHKKETLYYEFLLQNAANKAKQDKTNHWLYVPFQEKRLSIQLLFLNIEDLLNSVNLAFSNFGKYIAQETTTTTTSNTLPTMDNTPKRNLHILLEGLNPQPDDLVIETMIRAIYLGNYSFQKDQLKKLGKQSLFQSRPKLCYSQNLTITILTSQEISQSIQKGITYGESINYGRMLGDLPNNYLRPNDFAAYVTELANNYNLSYEILGSKELKEMHCGGILGVNQGSEQEAKLIVIRYTKNENKPFIGIIGKGIMFDSGGYHLKDTRGMDGMKYDMCGAANILSVMEILAKRKSCANVIAVIPVAENCINEKSYKMGDVLTTMSGKTVEVENLDAEGRLILCDAITYAVKQEVTKIIDLATLTYSCQSALGNEMSGIFSNNEAFYDEFTEMASLSQEKLWRLPLHESYHKKIRRSKTADLINYSVGDAGASVAASFLEEFVEGIPWIHLDTVGTAVIREETPYRQIGASGVMAGTIAAYIEEY